MSCSPLTIPSPLSAPTGARVLVLWLPAWPIQRLVAQQPELERRALLVAERTSRGELVRCCNRWAAQRGIQVGMTVSEARSRAHTRDRLVVEPLAAAADRRALGELALCCEPYSFCIGLEDAAEPDCLLLDVTGVAHLFGDEPTLAHRLQEMLHGRRLEGRIAIAESLGAAWGAAHYLARSGQPAVIPAGRLASLAELPTASLRLNSATLLKLRRLGIGTVAQVLRLERAALPARFGRELLQRLDQWTGVGIELIAPHRVPPRFVAERHLEAGLAQPTAIEQFWTVVLEQLLALLQPRRLGTRRLDCRLTLEDRPPRELTIRLCVATASARSLTELWRLHLERSGLDAPLLGLRLEACDVAPLTAVQRSLLAHEPGDNAYPLVTLLDRLGSRLGEQAVGVPRLLPDPVPERAVQFVPAAALGAPLPTDAPTRLLPLDRPTVLYPRPQPVQITFDSQNETPVRLTWQGQQFDLAGVWGPERIESGWWQGPSVRRDYYWVETARGQRFWLFRVPLHGEWFCHGEWF